MKPSTRIFFFGTPEIAVPSLEALNADPKIEIVGVGVFPDRPVGRKQVLTPCPVKVCAQALNLKVYELGNKTDLVNIFKTQTFDLGVVIAFGMIFPASILNIPPLGVVNVHFSLLPAYRGASPVQAAILNGDHVSGITWQRMVAALDAGDVIQQIKHDIIGKSTVTLWSEMAEITAKSFPQFVHDYATGSLIAEPQKESLATFCGKFTRADGEIKPVIETAQNIYQKYLAFDPWPGIFLETETDRIKILECQITPGPNTVALECASQTQLHLVTIQVAGKKPQPAHFINF